MPGPDAPPAFTCARVAVETAPGEYALRAERATLELQPLSLSVKAASTGCSSSPLFHFPLRDVVLGHSEAKLLVVPGSRQFGWVVELASAAACDAAVAACRQRGASVTNAAWLRAPPTPHGADVEAIVDRLCVQPHLAEAVLSKLVGVLQPQR